MILKPFWRNGTHNDQKKSLGLSVKVADVVRLCKPSKLLVKHDSGVSEKLLGIPYKPLGIQMIPMPFLPNGTQNDQKALGLR